MKGQLKDVYEARVAPSLSPEDAIRSELNALLFASGAAAALGIVAERIGRGEDAVAVIRDVNSDTNR